MLEDLWTHRDLIVTLTRRQFHVRYRQSALGLVWAILVPFATLGAGALVFEGIAGVDTGQSSYALFTMAGLVPWVFFASSLSFGANAVVQEKPLVTKLAFPRAALPLSIVGVSFLDAAISGAIFVVMAYTLGDGLPVTALLVPVFLLLEGAFVVGLVLLASAVNVFARDIRLGVPLLVQLLLLLTPVMYPLEDVPNGLRSWLLANPMTGIVESIRDALIGGRLPEFVVIAPALLGATVALVVGFWYFAATESRFADVL